MYDMEEILRCDRPMELFEEKLDRLFCLIHKKEMD